MEELIQGFACAIAIAEQYGFNLQSARETLQSIRSFTVTVPIIGAFNTGKSAILNALLGRRLLPTGIVATTSVPTELAFGENGVTVHRNGRESRVGLGELRGDFDAQGVTLLQVSFSHPFLQSISSIKLVDLPGLDSGVSGREQLLRDYLPQSLAYLLVFSADEPIVKESIALFLSELCLMNVPVFAVLNKCDKIAPEELEQAQQFLKEQLCQMFHLQDFAICCVSAREKDGTDPLAELLVSLQARADTIARRKFYRLLSDCCRELRDYLSFRLSFEALPISELDSRIRYLKNQATTLIQALEQEDSRFLARVEDGKQAMQKRLNQALEDATFPMETMLFSGQNPYTYVDGMLRSTLAAGVLDFFEPAVSSYLRQTVGLLERRGTSEKTGGVIERFRREVAERCTQKVATPAIETMLSLLPDTRPLFEQLIGTGRFLSEKQRGTLHIKIEETLLQQLREVFGACIESGLQQSAEAVRQLTRNAALEESKTQAQALLDIQSSKQADETLHREDCQRMRDNLATVDTLLAKLDDRHEEVLL